MQGDLDEQFYVIHEKTTLFRAKLSYWFQVLNYLRPFAIKGLTISHYNNYSMISNYFKIGWRNLLKQKMYSGIKIGGLALGVTACILIALFVGHELSYDKNYPNGNQLYRVIGIYNINGEIRKGVYFPAPVASVLENDFPEIEGSGRFLASELLGSGSGLIKRADKPENFYEDNIIYADQQLLDLMQFQFVSGDYTQALAEPNSIAISRSKANKYFPDGNALGNTLILDNNISNPYKIGGVFEDFSSTSHLQYSFLLTMKGKEFWPGEQTFWRASNYHTYIKIRPGTNIEDLELKITDGIVKNYMLSSWRDAGIVDADEFAENVSLELQPVSDIHLHSADIMDGQQHGDIRFVWLFGTIAIFILIIACINFINLSTAKSANRAREVGLRKVIGSFRRNLISQFLTESVLYSFLSFSLAILLAWLLLPYFNELSSKSLNIPWNEWFFIPLLLLASVFIGVLAGFYPAIYLSGFRPIQVIKGSVSRGSKNSAMRSSLVIIQFTTSIVLIIGTFTIYRQMDFILNTKVGFDKEQVLLIEGTNALGNQLSTFKKELLGLSDVKSVSVSDYLPVKGAGSKRNRNLFYKGGKVGIDKSIGGQIWQIDHDYIKTMGMHIQEGRDFDVEIASDSQAVIINKTMVQELGLDEPVGQEMTNGRESWTIIGVVDDFHYESMTEEIRPLCLEIGTSASIVSVKVNTSDLSQSIEKISNLWRRFSPNEAFRYTFLDQSYAKMYSSVLQMGRIFTSFAILAITIACLGLFALSAFMVEQRSKEISIRLVMGASVRTVFNLLTKNYLILILISLIIAIPIGWYIMHLWLEDYIYRIQIGWNVFVFAGLITALIALITISFQSVKAAMVNPVDKLRSE